MKLLVQRSKNSKVTIDGKINGEISHGYVVLVGLTHEDNETIVDKMIDKLINLRIFEDNEGKMNLSLLDTANFIPGLPRGEISVRFSTSWCVLERILPFS